MRLEKTKRISCVAVLTINVCEYMLGGGMGGGTHPFDRLQAKCVPGQIGQKGGT